MKAISHYEIRLKTRLDELEGRLQEVETSLDQKKSNDWEEAAVESEGDEVLEELGHTGEVEIRAIKAALDRIADGTFGECVRCGNSISEARLDAVPHAVFCRNCT